MRGYDFSCVWKTLIRSAFKGWQKQVQAVNQEVLNKTLEWLTDGSNCWLATVVATYGSSPRPCGSLMACNPTGSIVGSLSGGCVEDNLLEKLTNGVLATDRTQFYRYGETDEEAEELGLPCGGHLDIIVEPLIPNADTIGEIREVVRRLEERKLVKRILNIETGERRVDAVDVHESFQYDGQKLRQVHGPSHQLFIIGASTVAKYVAEFAQVLEYQVTICDPRRERLDEMDVCGVNLVCDMPDDAIRKLATDSQSAIVALTHDPRIDDMGLLEAFDTDAFYIGAMGSTRTSANRMARLKQFDVSPENLARLHAPIGVSIGSKTPPEIAISIMAEIVKERSATLKKRDSHTLESKVEATVHAQ